MKPVNSIKSRNQSVYTYTRFIIHHTFSTSSPTKTCSTYNRPKRNTFNSPFFVAYIYFSQSISPVKPDRSCKTDSLWWKKKKEKKGRGRRGKRKKKKKEEEEAHINHTLDKIPTQLYTLLGCAVPVLALNLDLFPKQFCNNLARRRGLVPDEKWSERISVLFFSTAERGTASLKGAPPTVLSSSWCTAAYQYANIDFCLSSSR